jgi:hypothetical protein
LQALAALSPSLVGQELLRAQVGPSRWLVAPALLETAVLSLSLRLVATAARQQERTVAH